MTTFMTYKEECEVLLQCVAELEKERDRLSELCDKRHSECDDMREANNHLANVADALKQQRDELLAALEYHQEQTRPIQKTIDAIASVKEK